MTVQEKPKVIPVDDFIRDELYPGYAQAFGAQPFAAGRARPFGKADGARPPFDQVQYVLRNVFKVPGA